MATPRALINLARTKPETDGSGMNTACLLHSETNTISTDLDRLSEGTKLVLKFNFVAYRLQFYSLLLFQMFQMAKIQATGQRLKR